MQGARSYRSPPLSLGNKNINRWPRSGLFCDHSLLHIIFLLTDLFQPLRFWYLFIHFNPTSPLSWGTFILCAYPIFTGIYIYFLFKGNVRWSKIFGVISLPTAIGVHGYTGFVLGFAKARVLWNTAVMPSYFLASQ
jgi:formate-dependent nitrite reductase membrane component NrfD